jgi:HSP20 family protein
MTLIRWKPLRDVTAWHPVTNVLDEFNSIHNEIDRVFDRVRGGEYDTNPAQSWLPAVDIMEQENSFVIKAELPGVDKKDVKITVQNDVLTIKGEKKQETEKNGENYYRTERLYGSFQRSFTLPATIASEKIDASYDNGVLILNLPKLEEAKPKEIEVKVK